MKAEYIAIILATTGAQAAPPDAVRPEVRDWIRSLTDPEGGAPCCDESDCRLVDFRANGTGYEVLIAERWLKVPRWVLLPPRPNPSGRAVACYVFDKTGLDGVRFFCFLPGPEG